MADGQYKFSIGLDSKQLELDVAQAKKAFDSLVKQAQQAGVKIDNIPNPFENIGKSAPQVAQATQQFNGLNMATQQLVRELPAATMGLDIFFLAVSNNLPILADQIKQVSAANKELAQQGKPTVSVFKQIGKSITSWQSLLVVGITLLSMYGKEIGAWVSSLFKGKEAADALKDAQNGLNEEIAKNGLGIGKEIGKYESLRREFEAINGDIKEQERFVRDNQSAFDDLGVSVNSVIDAEDFFSGEGTEAFLKALRLRAEALAAQKLAIEQYEEAMLKEREANEAAAEGVSWWDNAKSSMSYISTTGTGPAAGPNQGAQVQKTAEELHRQRIAQIRQEANVARATADAYFDMHDAKMKAASDTLEAANIEQSDKDKERQREAELRAAELRAKQIADASARLMSDAERKATQAKVDAMKEGIQKTIAQINHNYDLEEQAITKREKELKELRGGMLTSGEQKAIDDMRKANAAKRDRSTQSAYDAVFAEADAWLEESNNEMTEASKILNNELDKRTAAWEAYHEKYGSIKEKLFATTSKYNRLIANAETEGERKALEAERDTILAQYEVEASGFAKELESKTREELNAMVTELSNEVKAKEEAFQALDDTTGVDGDEYRQQIAKLNAQIAKLKEELNKANRAIGNSNWAEATQVFQSIAGTAQEAAEGIAEFDESLGMALNSIAQIASLSVDVIGAMQGVQEAFKKTGEAASNMEKASAILAVIAVAIKAVSSIANIAKEHEEAMHNAALAAEEYANALAKIRNSDLRGSFSTIFGKDSYGEFLALLNETKSQLNTIEDKAAKIAEASEGAAFNLGSQTSIWGVIGDLKDKQKAADGKLIADMRSGWQKMWGTGNDNIKLTSLSEFYEDGKLNVDKLKAYYDNYKDYLTDAQADLLKSLIDTGEMYEENMAAINGYMSDIFGNLGASITDSLVDAFRNGTDAAGAMGDAVGNVVEQIATDMAHAAFIQPLLDEAQKGIKALNEQRAKSGMSDEEYMRQLMEITTSLMGDAKNAGEGVNDFLAYLQQLAKDMGLDIFESDSAKSAYSKGFQAMSQETGSELNGRFTDIQGQTHRIADAVEFMKGLQVQHTQHMQSVSSTLASIHNDTSLIAQHTKALGDMRDDISAMRRAMDNGII